MARPTRSERRARREAREQSSGSSAVNNAAAPKPGASGSLTERARARQQQRPASQPIRQQTGRREPAPRGRFVRESWGELKKVEWPGRSQVTQATIVVIIACAIVGAFLFAADRAFEPLVELLIGE